MSEIDSFKIMKATMQLADSFLHDLDELSDNNNKAQVDFNMDEESHDDLDSVFKLRTTQRYVNILRKVEEEALQKQDKNVEEEEYQLVAECTSLVADVEIEVVRIHNFIRDNYRYKFPELELLVHHPVDYARVVKMIGNEMDVTLLNFDGILPSDAIMVVSVMASTTSGKSLSEEKLGRAMEACDRVLALGEDKKKVLDFVGRRMNCIAPNLSAVVGTEVAAKLMVTAGGLSELVRMTDSTIQLLGANRKNITSFSTQLRVGYIEETEIFQKTPLSQAAHVCRLIAAKSCLAARLDFAGGDPTGETGRIYKEQILRKIEKRLEAMQKGKQLQPLSVPDLERKKNKRGGRRHRKMKERYAVTDMRKLANRMQFGVPEESSLGDGFGVGYGMLGQAGLRASVCQNKLGAKISKKFKYTD